MSTFLAVPDYTARGACVAGHGVSTTATANSTMTTSRERRQTSELALGDE
jgi:hypothetical protein